MGEGGGEGWGSTEGWEEKAENCTWTTKNKNKKEIKQNEKNKDFYCNIQTILSFTETDDRPLLFNGINSTSAEWGLCLLKFAGWFICETGWSPSPGKPPNPEKQHIKKLLQILTTLINLIWMFSQCQLKLNWIPSWILEKMFCSYHLKN